MNIGLRYNWKPKARFMILTYRIKAMNDMTSKVEISVHETGSRRSGYHVFGGLGFAPADQVVNYHLAATFFQVLP